MRRRSAVAPVLRSAVKTFAHENFGLSNLGASLTDYQRAGQISRRFPLVEERAFVALEPYAKSTADYA
jgi:hypothetical protein